MSDDRRRAIRLIYKKLYSCFGPQNWWPAQTAFEVVVGAILIICVIPLIIIEVPNRYCALFPGIFNAWQPGACP